MKSNAKGQNHIVAKPKVTEEDCLSITSKVTEPSHRLKLVNRLRSSVWLTAREERRLVGNFENEADATSFQNRHRL